MAGSDGGHRLGFDVRSLEGETLLPAGELLTAEVIAGVAGSGRVRPAPAAPILEHGRIRRDLARAARQGPYAGVFGGEEEYADLERRMAAVRLPEPCLRALDWFREHDGYTYRHILMVFALTCLLARRLGRSGPEADAEAMAGPLHDLGKICLPGGLLRKGTALLRSERALLEQHTLAGHLLLCRYVADPEEFTARVARDHHERRDGSGYPRGVRLADPLVEIVAACDVYDALISPRPYRPRSFDNRTALEELTGLAGKGRLSWEVVQLLVAQNRHDKPEPERCAVSLERRGTPPEGNLYGVILEDGSPPR